MTEMLTGEATEAPTDARGRAEVAKRAQILEGARRVFLARGFDGASMDEIARAAKVSKGTLYSYFESKDALFRALIEERKRWAAEQLCRFDHEDEDVRGVLLDFACRLISALTEPAHVALVRIVIAAADRFPDLGRAFFEAGPAFGAEQLAAYLAARARTGALAIDDAERAAWQLLGLCTHPVLIAVVMGARPRPDATAIARHAEAAVDTFLRAWRAGA